MIREIVAAYTDPLAGSYLGGFTLLGLGVLAQSPLLVFFGTVLAIGALLAAGVIAYVE